MKLHIKDISAVYINPDRFLERQNKIESWIHTIGLNSVTTIAYNETFPDRAITMNHAHKFALETNLRNVPFILFEDDAAIMNSLPEYFDIPEEADLVYLGGSNYIYDNNKSLYIEEYNKDFYRVHNMLSFHAVLFPNKKSVEKVIKLLEKAISENKFNDITIANSSKENVFLVPKEGNYFFQDDYTSNVTKFYWKDNLKFLK